MDEATNRQKVEKAFRHWQDGTGYITDLLADDLEWTIVGRSRASKTYTNKERFVGEVLGALRRPVLRAVPSSERARPLR